MPRQPLFTREPIGQFLDRKLRALAAEVDGMADDALLDADEEELAGELAARYAVERPVLREDKQVLDQTMAPLTVSPFAGLGFGGGGQRRVEAPRYELTVPYDGDEEVFFLTPNPHTFGGPMPEAEIRPGEVRVTWHQAVDAPAGQIKAWLDEQVASLNGFLRQSRANTDAFNTSLPAQARGIIAARRARLQAARDTAGALGYPMKRREDAADYETPVRRRVLTSLPEAAAPAAGPRYTLGDADYESALAVLERQRNALERSPTLTAQLNEEQIRLILLVGLNAVFEGQAMGEVFNGAGKTDILIRVQDSNVFVGECKIWRGPEAFREAIGQLLSYLTWRDTKGALILFIRNTDVTAVIEKAVAEIEAHPCHVRTLPTPGGSARRDFVLHADGDVGQILRLAFLPFALRAPTAG